MPQVERVQKIGWEVERAWRNKIFIIAPIQESRLEILGEQGQNSSEAMIDSEEGEVGPRGGMGLPQ